MSDVIDRAGFHLLVRFLDACERAAVPPPAKLMNALAALTGWPSTVGLPGPGAPVTNFEELGLKPPAGTTFPEELPKTRDERIALLSVWMKRYPAHAWLAYQPSVRAALASFRRVRGRKHQNPRYADDLAEFRFWRCAALAAAFRDMDFKPSPHAAQRVAIERAVMVLQQMIMQTSLLDDVGFGWSEAEAFRQALTKVLSVGKMRRRPRSDAHTADREFVDTLTTIFWQEFKAAPPTPIIALAGLKILSPDSAALTKRIKALAVSLASNQR